MRSAGNGNYPQCRSGRILRFCRKGKTGQAGVSENPGVSREGVRGAVTEDGCSVEVYRALVNAGEAEFIDDAIPPNASVLDLGAGTGRIADALAALGHEVVAVDNSADMLAAVKAAQPVLADIETYRDPRCFDAVLLASYLVNTANADLRRSLLNTVAYHLDAAGTAFIEWHPPEWFDALTPGTTYSGTIGAVSSTLHVTSLRDDQLAATVTYAMGDGQWSQSFLAQRLTAAQVEDELREVGLALLDDDPFRDNWILATPAGARQTSETA